MAGATFGQVHVSLFVAGAAFGDVHVSLFVAGAAFGDVHVSLFVAGAAFGEVHVSLLWQVQHLVKFMCHFSWQAQHLVKFMCHFLWQAQHLVKCGMIAGAGHVVIFHRICFWRTRKVPSAARRVAICVFMVGSFSDHARSGLGSCSDRSRIGNDTSTVFVKFLLDLEVQFCVAGAIFGEVGG